MNCTLKIPVSKALDVVLLVAEVAKQRELCIFATLLSSAKEFLGIPLRGGISGMDLMIKSKHCYSLSVFTWTLALCFSSCCFSLCLFLEGDWLPTGVRCGII